VSSSHIESPPPPKKKKRKKNWGSFNTFTPTNHHVKIFVGHFSVWKVHIFCRHLNYDELLIIAGDKDVVLVIRPETMMAAEHMQEAAAGSFYAGNDTQAGIGQVTTLSVFVLCFTTTIIQIGENDVFGND
jgi:hypothetical protein